MSQMTDAAPERATPSYASRSAPGTRGVTPSLVPSGHVPALDGVRGVAIALVIVYHVAYFGGMYLGHSTSAPVGELWLFALARHGWLGVDLFFALSGFLITGILYDAKGRTRYLRTFFGRRMLRIFPLYYTALVAALALSFALGQSASERSADAWAWIYLSNVKMGVSGVSSVSMHLQHFWSLAVEEQFYLVWPFLVLALSRRGMMRACVAGFALAIGARYVLTPYFAGPVERLMPGRLDALAAGSWVALALRGTIDVERARVRALLVLRWSAAALGVVLLTTTLQLTTRRAELGSLAIALGAVLFAATIATVVLSGDGRCARTLSRRAPRFLGRYSYALYVVHQPLILLLLRTTLFQRPVDAGASRMPMYGELLVATAALSVSVALVSWHGLEKHFLRMKERLPSSPAIPAHTAARGRADDRA